MKKIRKIKTRLRIRQIKSQTMKITLIRTVKLINPTRKQKIQMKLSAIFGEKKFGDKMKIQFY